MDIRYTPFAAGTRLELVVDDKSVSSLSVLDLDVRIGDRVVRVGGIGGVGTPRVHRMKGYARHVLEASIQFMHDKGYHLSGLYGIPSFYTRWGFAPAMPESRITIKTRDAELARRRFAVRDMTPNDIQPVRRLYAAANATRTGTVVRGDDWPGFERGPGWTSRFGVFVVEDGDAVIGYAMFSLDLTSLELGEVGYRDRSAWSTILAEAARLAWERRLEQITLDGPSDDPFFAYCHRYGCSIDLTYSRNAHCMARVIDQNGLVAKLEPLLRERLSEAGLEARGSIVFQTDLGSTVIKLGSDGEKMHIRLPQWALAQLALGYRDIHDLLFESEAQAHPAALAPLEAMFPAGFPYTYHPDRY